MFILAEALHYIFWGKVFFFLINSIIMFAFILAWAFSDGVYTPDKSFRLLRLKLGIVMAFWFFCKCCHDRFFMESDILCRISWYAYYVALIFLPVLCYEFSLHFGANEGEKFKKRMTVIYTIAVVLILFVMTNDFHQLAFSFPNGIEEWADDYSRGVIYFASAGFAFVMVLLAVFNVFRQCTLPKSKKYIWIPAIPVGLLLIYVLLYFFDLDLRFPDLITCTSNVRFFVLNDVLCFLVVVFIESCGLVYRIATELPDEQSFILHKIRNEIQDKLNKVDSLINSPDVIDEEAYKYNIYFAGVIQTFNKRVSNLMLLGRQNGKLDFSELALSFAESVEYLKLNGITEALVTEGNGSYTADEMISVYREFEDRIEKILPNLGAVMVVLSSNGKKMKLRVLAEDKEGNEL